MRDGADDLDDLDESETPFDDPVARTRMAWLRTMLIVAVIGLLMWRSAYIDGQAWWSLAWLIPSALMLAIAAARVRVLTRDHAGESRITPLAWMVAGFLTLAVVGAALAVV
jgi:hypothetical protein